MHKTRKGTCVFPHRNLLHIVPSNSPIVGCDPVGRPISRSMHGMDYPCSERGCPMAGTTHRVAPYGIEDEYNAVHMVGHHHKLITNVHVPSSRPVYIVPSNPPIVRCDPVGRPISRSMHGMDYPCSERGCPMAGTTHRVAPYGIEDE
jgi:hypothetical protein